MSFLKRYILIRSLALPTLGLAIGLTFLALLAMPMILAAIAGIYIHLAQWLLGMTR